MLETPFAPMHNIYLSERFYLRITSVMEYFAAYNLYVCKFHLRPYVSVVKEPSIIGTPDFENIPICLQICVGYFFFLNTFRVTSF